MQKYVRRPSPEFLEPIESHSMLKKRKEISSLVKLKNERNGLETTIASCSGFRCCANLDSLPKNAKTSMFVVLSLLYGKLVIVACIAFIVSQEITKSFPVQFYEGFYTFLFGVSIMFFVFLFCFLLQDSSCCPGNRGKGRKLVKNTVKGQSNGGREIPKKKDKNKKVSDNEENASQSQTTRNRPNKLQREVYPRKIKDITKSRDDSGKIEISTDSADADENTSLVVVTPKKSKNSSEEKLTEPSLDSIDIEATSAEVNYRRSKTSQNLHHYGSFFLRVGTIGFGLGTMIYVGFEFGKIFEIPFTSSCYDLLRTLNPILQMVFTFMQMHFIFTNARLKIHRFKFIARFGLIHVVATNLCVWIKTLVFESLYEINREPVSYFNYSKNVVNNLSTEFDLVDSGNRPLQRMTTRFLSQIKDSAVSTSKTLLGDVSTVKKIPSWVVEETSPTKLSTNSAPVTFALPTSTLMTPSTMNYVTSQTTPVINTIANTISNHSTSLTELVIDSFKGNGFPDNISAITDRPNLVVNLMKSAAEALAERPRNFTTNLFKNDSCGRVNIMGTIVQDAAPILYPFVIEYSLIGAAVIFIMWRHIGSSTRYISEENMEHKLGAIISRKLVTMAHLQNGSRVDCVGASKGLFFGLLVLVGSLIATLLFFVLIHHKQFSWLAVYLADVSHSIIMALSILAILIGFCRAKNLRFYAADATDLNDILLRVSAFGVFIYASFSIIAGARYAFVRERNFLVLITGTITIVQVVLQILFIGDMSRRHVYLPEHDGNKPGRQIVTFLLICNITMWILFTFESQKVLANPVQSEFFGKKAWKLVEYITLPLCIFHRFHSAVALAEIWKSSYKLRVD